MARNKANAEQMSGGKKFIPQPHTSDDNIVHVADKPTCKEQEEKERTIWEPHFDKCIELLAYPNGMRKAKRYLKAQGMPPGKISAVVRRLNKIMCMSYSPKDIEYMKTQAVARIFAALQKSMAKGKMREVLGFEQVLAKLQGTEAPMKREIDIRSTSTSVQVALGTIDPEKLAEYMERARQLAGAAPSALPEHVDVEAEIVDDAEDEAT